MVETDRRDVLQAQPINEAMRPIRTRWRATEAMVPRGLVMVVGGVGGLDWCGIALRRLLKNARPPYAIQIFPWGLGFGRWHADLTNITNRDAKARLIAETIRQLQGQPTADARSSWSPNRAARESRSRPSNYWMKRPSNAWCCWPRPCRRTMTSPRRSAPFAGRSSSSGRLWT